VRKYRFTIAAAVIFVVLLAWVLVKERGRVPEKGEAFGLDVKTVTRLEITPAQGQPLTLEKRDDQWWITAPFQGWANKDEVERIARTICELKPSKRPEADPDTPEFGLKNPSMTVRMWAGGRKIEMFLGASTPVGGDVFAKITGRKGVFLVASYVKTDLEKKPEDLRDKKLAHYDKEKLVSVDLQSTKGTFRLEARPEGEAKTWYLTQPISTKADRWSVDTLTNRPTEVEAKAFEAVPGNLATVGLDKPRVKLTLHFEDGKTTTILLGNKVKKTVPKQYGEGTEEQEVVYAMNEGRPELLLVEASFFTDLDKDLMGLRDKHVVSVERSKIVGISVQRRKGLNFSVAKRADVWYLDTPQPGKAKQTKVDDILWDIEDLETSEFIEKPADLKQYGLAVPDTVVTITTSDNKSIRLSFGYKTKDNRYYMKTDQSDTVYVVSDLLLSALPNKVEDIKGE